MNNPARIATAATSVPASGAATPVASPSSQPIKLAKNGTPLDANDWTEADWLDLHRTMKRLIRRVAARHRKT